MCHFPIGILGQVWYLIVSIPDLCTLTYFALLLKNLCINKCDMAVHQTLGLISVFAHCTPILLVLSCGFSSESLLFSKITFFSHTTKTRYSDVDTVHVRHMQRARVGGGGVWTPLKIASSIACIWTVNIGPPSSPTGTLEH